MSVLAGRIRFDQRLRSGNLEVELVGCACLRGGPHDAASDGSRVITYEKHAEEYCQEEQASPHNISLMPMPHAHRARSLPCGISRGSQSASGSKTLPRRSRRVGPRSRII
jgi:hypothetical protein